MLRDPVQQTPEQDDAKVPRFGTPDREKHTKARHDPAEQVAAVTVYTARREEWRHDPRHDGSAGTEGDHAGT